MARHAYKPTALKLPYLIIFLALFCLSIGLIERLLSQSQGPSATFAISSRRIVKKQAEPETIRCEEPAQYTAIFKVSAADHSAACTRLSAAIATPSTNLSATTANQFNAISSSIQAILNGQSTLESISNLCRGSEGATRSYDADNRDPNYVQTIGCSSSQRADWDFFYNGKDYATGGFSLDGTTITVSFPQISGAAGTRPQRLLVLQTPNQAKVPGGPPNSATSTLPGGGVTAPTPTPTPAPGMSTSNGPTQGTAQTKSQDSTNGDQDRPTDAQHIDKSLTETGRKTGSQSITAPTLVVVTSSRVSTNEMGSKVTELVSVTAVSDGITLNSALASSAASEFSRSVAVSGMNTRLTKTGTWTGTTSRPVFTGFALANNEVMDTTTFTKTTYFSAIFLAPIIAVIIKIWYEDILSALKLVEPFHLINGQGGAPAAVSVLAQYLRSSLSFDAARSLLHHRFLPLWSIVMFIATTLAPSIASASMDVRARNVCLIDGNEYPCDPGWITDVRAIRGLEALLGFCAVMTVALIIWTWKYTVSVSSNPASIASVVAMMNHKPLIRDLLQIDPDANDAEFEACLQQHHFWLDSHRDTRTGQMRYGIVGTRDIGGYHAPSTGGQSYMPIPGSKLTNAMATTRGKWVTNFVLDSCCLATILLLLGLVVGYYLDGEGTSFVNFFSSGKFLPGFLMIIIATLADIQLKNIEREVRITEPYRRLSLGNARAETTIFLPLNGTCWSNLPRCIKYALIHPRGNMWWQTIVSFVACLSDLNLIAVAGVLYTEGQIQESLVFCTFLTVAFSSSMLLVVLVTMIWWRNVGIIKSMRRTPETIAAIMSYLCGSVLVQHMNFSDGPALEAMSEKDRNDHFKSGDKRYRFGQWRSEVDEKIRWIIDLEVMPHDARVSHGEKGAVTVNVSGLN